MSVTFEFDSDGTMEAFIRVVQQYGYYPAVIGNQHGVCRIDVDDCIDAIRLAIRYYPVTIKVA